MDGDTGGDISKLLRNGDAVSSNTVSLVSVESEVVPLSEL